MTANTRPLAAAAMPPALASSPAATRRQRPSWLEPRLGIGIALILVSVFAGSRIVAQADDFERVWAVRHALAAGTVLAADDLIAKKARLYGGEDHYVLKSRSLVGKTLTRDMGSGELIATSAIRKQECGATVAISVAAQHLPTTVQKGQRINLYATAKDADTQLVLAGVTVQKATKPKAGLLTANSQWSLAVRVHEEKAQEVVQSVRGAELDVSVVSQAGADGDACTKPTTSSQTAATPED